ncbi:MAG: hypothetical protein KME16_25125 [Scytolyngbya sp. HA4215-MV1]|nr:hypothetical protein [Scytolyngbya sp. HA4215-MV1]
MNKNIDDTSSVKPSISQIDELTETLRKIAIAEVILEPEMQEELVNLLGVTAKLKSELSVAQLSNNKKKNAQLEAMIPNVKVAVHAIQKSSNKILVKRLRCDVAYSILKIDYPLFSPCFEAFKSFLYKAETHTKVCFGLFIALPIHLLAPVVLAYLLAIANFHLQPLFAESVQRQSAPQNSLVSQQDGNDTIVKMSEYDFEEASALLILSAMAGATGSVVSIMLRLDQYRNSKYRETLLPVFVGAFKPAIGAFFGIFVFALISSTLLPITISKNETKPINRWLAFLAISFVVGFSERLANDVISKAEQIVPGGKPSQGSDVFSEPELLTAEEE